MYRYFRPTSLSYNNKGTIPITLWIIIYLNLLYTTTELQQFSFMHPSDFKFPFNSDKLSTMPKAPKTPMTGQSSKLTLLGSATGKTSTSQRASRKEQSDKAKAKANELERINQKRTSDNISTGSGSRGHATSRSRTAESGSWSHVVSPNGKGDPNAKAIEGQEKSTASIVSTDKDKDKHDDMVLDQEEKKNPVETDKENQNDKVPGEEEKQDQTDTEMDMNTKANANAAGKRSIEDLNRDLKKNVIYEWPAKPRFSKTPLAFKLPDTFWRKTKKFELLQPDEDGPGGQALMVNVASFGTAWTDKFPGEKLNNEFVTTEKVQQLMTGLVMKTSNLDDKTLKRIDLLKTATRFCKTSPEIFGPQAFDAKGNLTDSMDARFWLGICQAFGSTFDLKEPIDMTAILRQRREDQKAAATRTLKFAPNTKGIGGEIHTSGAGMFLSQAGHRSKKPSVPVELPKKFRRTFQSYMKLVLPSNAPGVEKNEEACSNFRWAINRMIKHDPSLVVTVFPTQNSGAVKPIWRDVSAITGRDKLKPYSDRLWIGEGKRVWMTIYIAHNSPQLSFMTSDIQEEFMEAGIELFVSNVQSAETATAGYLIGSSSTMNQDHWTMLLSQHPKLKLIDIECRDQPIKIDATEKYNQKTEVRAMHIICAKDSLAQCRKAIKGIYNKKRSGKEATRKLPEGRLMKFVPHAGTTDDIMPTRERRERFLNAKNTQRCFVSRNIVTVIQGISDLDLPLRLRPNEEKITLRQSIVCVKSITDLETPLFIGVDMKWNGDIVATSDSSFGQEAQMFIAHLPLYLEHILGNLIWKWFLPEHRVFMQENFEYSSEDGVNRVVDKIKSRPKKRPKKKGDEDDGDISMNSASTTSSIDSDDYAGGFAAESGAAREAYESAAQCQPFEFLEDQEDHIEFNLALQLTLEIPVDADGILGDDNNSTDTFTSNVSAATAATIDQRSQDDHSCVGSLVSEMTEMTTTDKQETEKTETGDNGNTESDKPQFSTSGKTDDRPSDNQS
jgi:hypothetical protein